MNERAVGPLTIAFFADSMGKTDIHADERSVGPLADELLRMDEKAVGPLWLQYTRLMVSVIYGLWVNTVS